MLLLAVVRRGPGCAPVSVPAPVFPGAPALNGLRPCPIPRVCVRVLPCARVQKAVLRPVLGVVLRGVFAGVVYFAMVARVAFKRVPGWRAPAIQL